MDPRIAHLVAAEIVRDRTREAEARARLSWGLAIDCHPATRHSLEIPDGYRHRTGTRLGSGHLAA